MNHRPESVLPVSRPVDLVVPCSKRKQGPTHKAISFGELFPRRSAMVLAQSWLRHAQGACPRRTTPDLYAGNGWRQALAAYSAAQRMGPCRLWVMFAGFGLVGLTEPLPVYSASFSEGPDRVADRLLVPESLTERHQAWWAAINSARDSGPSPLQGLPGELCLLAVGSDYLGAIKEDLIRRVENRGTHSLLIVPLFRSATGVGIESCVPLACL